jgi:hypothetical protein
MKVKMSAFPTPFVTVAVTTDFAAHPRTGTKSRTECAILLPISGAAMVVNIAAT